MFIKYGLKKALLSMNLWELLYSYYVIFFRFDGQEPVFRCVIFFELLLRLEISKRKDLGSFLLDARQICFDSCQNNRLSHITFFHCLQTISATIRDRKLRFVNIFSRQSSFRPGGLSRFDIFGYSCCLFITFCQRLQTISADIKERKSR